RSRFALTKRLGEGGRAQRALFIVSPPPPPTSGVHHAFPRTEFSPPKPAHATLKQLEDFAFEQSVQPLPYSCMIRVGVAAEKINETARKTGLDLIAIGTRGYTGLKYAFLGSTTAQVVRTAPCPVLVVRELDYLSAGERARRGRTPLQFKKVLVPFDFSECSRVGLHYALGVAREFQSSLLLFHSVNVQTYAHDDASGALQV